VKPNCASHDTGRSTWGGSRVTSSRLARLGPGSPVLLENMT
jgi:hypothetical protein